MSATVRIGVVDDDASIRSALGRLLSVAGFQVAAFDSAEDFLLHMNDHEFDCLVLDVHLPGVDGVALARKLRGDGRRVPIVFLTADHRIAYSDEMRRLGAACLIKPADDVTLLAAIRNALDSGETAL